MLATKAGVFKDAALDAQAAEMSDAERSFKNEWLINRPLSKLDFS